MDSWSSPRVTQSLLTNSGYWRWAAGVQLAGLPQAMVPLAYTTAASALTGSAATGALLVAAEAVAEVLCAVPNGRMLDRLGVSRGARFLLVGRGLAYLGMLAGLLLHLPTVMLVVLAALPGALGGGIGSGFRALLSSVVGALLLNRALAINAMATDGIIVLGPLVVAGLILLAQSAPLLAMTTASLLAVALVPSARHSGSVNSSAGDTSLIRLLLGWVCAAFALGHVTSTIEVAALPLVERLGAGPGGASVLVAVFALASILGSLVYVRINASGAALMASVLLLVMATGSLLVGIGSSWPIALAGATLIGPCVGPLLTIYTVRAELMIPATRRAEGFAILSTVQGLGFAAGSLTIGLLPLPAVSALGTMSAILSAAFVLRFYRHREST